MRNPFRRRMVVEEVSISSRRGLQSAYNEFREEASEGRISKRAVVGINSPSRFSGGVHDDYDVYNIYGCGVVVQGGSLTYREEDYSMQITFGGTPRAVKSAKKFLEGFFGEIK